jgi:hypothetical protein
VLRSHPPLLIRYSGWVLLCGILLVKITQYTAIGYALMFLGACGGVFQKFRSERGLWMLSALFAAMTGVILACFVLGTCGDIARHHIFDDGLSLQIEVALAMLVFFYQFLFLLKITRQNWAISKRGRRTELRIIA